MFNILWIMMLCVSVVAQRKKFTEEEAKAIIDCICKIHGHEMDSESYCSSKNSPTISSSESCGTTPLKYVESAIQATQPSPRGSHEWSATETFARDYEISQIDELEEYAQEYHSHDNPQAHQPRGHRIRKGSIREFPNTNFPDYKDIPFTSFSCSNKVHFPGFYADMETGCQVFHVCLPHRRESFLCPIGTIFNQAILACDYWYRFDCSLAAHYYDINGAVFQTGAGYKNSALGSMVDVLIEQGYSQSTQIKSASKPDGSDLSYILKFLPVKAKVFIYQKSMETRSNILSEANVGREKEPKTEEMKSQCILASPPTERKETLSNILAEAKAGSGKKPKTEENESQYISAPPPIERKDTISNVLAETNVEKGKEPKTEEMKPQYILVPPPIEQKETSETKVVTPEIESKHSDVTVPLNRVIFELFDITKEILGEWENYDIQVLEGVIEK